MVHKDRSEFRAGSMVVRSYVIRYLNSRRSGDDSKPRDFLPPDNELRTPFLCEILRLQIREQLRVGCLVDLDTYLQQYPEIAEDTEAIEKLRVEIEDFTKFNAATLELYNPVSDQVGTRTTDVDVATFSVVVERHSTIEDETVPIKSTVRDTAKLTGTILAGHEILEVIGYGGMGIVYRALDIRRNTIVALKTLSCFTPQSLYYFKNEFRLVADVTHPNLVNLYELVTEGEHWFFTMEYVKGVDFLTYTNVYEISEVDHSRLLSTLVQLANGIQALHQAGRLHRDLKPSNVMVTHQGRVVILDFGLAIPKDKSGAFELDGAVAGTFRYMSPEQASGKALTPASDWYSFGTMIYETVSGNIPFSTSGKKLLIEKNNFDAPRLQPFAANVHPDLIVLNNELLSRDPQSRPGGVEILRRLSHMTAEAGAEAKTDAASEVLLPFVGRDHELAQLRFVFQQAMSNRRPLVVDIQGKSGVGKSSLIQYFIDEIQERGNALVFNGKCYEHESVPFKALDSIVDAITRHLMNATNLDEILPEDVGPLGQVFPVLQRIPLVVGQVKSNAVDPLELRRRAVIAFRLLLRNLSKLHPLVLCIDDLQWGDHDSASLLFETLNADKIDNLMLALTFRSEQTETSPFLKTFFSKFSSAGVLRCSLELKPLTQADSFSLASRMLTGVQPELIDSVVRESGGNPLFVAELIRYLQGTDGATRVDSRLSLDDVLWQRISALPEVPRTLLEIAAVHGRPIRQAEMLNAAAIDLDQRPALAMLRSGRLVRSTVVTGEVEIESYHDRVRECVVARLQPDRKRAIHASLAHALLDSHQDEPEVLAGHFFECGELLKARTYFEKAAAQSAQSLAFERAAELYKRVLEIGVENDPQRCEMNVKLGEAYTNAGRGSEAAKAYLAALHGASSERQLELKRRAAQQLLTSGQVDEGLQLLQETLRAVGLSLASSQRKAFLSLLFHRMKLAVRGLNFKERPEDQVPSRLINQIDAGWAASLGLSMNDNTRAADIQTRHLLLALRAGEPARIARALAMEVPHMAGHTGTKMKRAAMAISSRAEELARRLDDSYLIALVISTRGVAEYLNERWQVAVELCQRGDRLFSEKCVGVAWERATTQSFALWSLQQAGDLKELSLRAPVLIAEAESRGDLFAKTNMMCFQAIIELMHDQPQNAISLIEHTNQNWSHASYHIQHYAFYQARVTADLYAGDYTAAWKNACDGAQRFNNSFLKRIQLFRVHVTLLQAYSALGLARISSSPQSLLKQAERLAQKLKKENTGWSLAAADFVLGVVAHQRNQTGQQNRLLSLASDRFEQNGMQLFAIAVRSRIAELDSSSSESVGELSTKLRLHGVENPERMIAAWAPGC